MKKNNKTEKCEANRRRLFNSQPIVWGQHAALTLNSALGFLRNAEQVMAKNCSHKDWIIQGDQKGENGILINFRRHLEKFKKGGGGGAGKMESLT